MVKSVDDSIISLEKRGVRHVWLVSVMKWVWQRNYDVTIFKTPAWFRLSLLVDLGHQA
jgi:hypothetical protein